MSPDKKLIWFQNHNYTSEAIARVRQLIITRWEESYQPTTISNPVMATSVASESEPNQVRVRSTSACYPSRVSRLTGCTRMRTCVFLQRRSRFLPATSTPALQRRPLDDILTYLDDPLESTQSILEWGGLMQYWHQASVSRPCLARMASDFCSAPGM